MDEKIFFNQMKFIRNRTILALDSVDVETVLVIPKGFNNNLLWNFGHIFWALEELMHSFGNEQSTMSQEWIEMFRIGSSPRDWKASPPSLSEIRSALDTQPSRIIKTFSGKLFDKLEKPFKLGSELELTTLAEVLGFINWHEGLHQGTITAMTKITKEI